MSFLYSKTSIHFLSAVLLTLSVMAVYSNTLHSPFLFDDFKNIIDNDFLNITSLSWDNIARVWEAPHPSANRKIPNLTFALNRYLGGQNPFGYHIVNIGIHVLCSLLVAFFFIQSQKYLSQEASHKAAYPWTAWAGAFLWALHPVQINAVTYIVQRMTSLAMLFSLLAFNTWLLGRRYVKKRSIKGFFYWGASSLFIVSALMCKESAAIIPLLIGIYELLLIRKGKFKINICYFLAAGICMAAAAVFLLGPQPWEHIFSGYSHRDFNLTERLMTESRVLWHYISIFVLPEAGRFTMLHEYPVSRGLFSPPTTFFSIIMWSFVMVMAWQMRERWYIFCWTVAWFLTAHLIESTVIPLEIIFEHRMYLPSVSLAFGTVYYIYSSSTLKKLHPHFPSVLIIMIILSVSASTYIRNMDFSDAVTLYQTDLKKYPFSKRMRLNLAVALNRQGNIKEGGKILSDLAASYPNDILVLQNWFSFLMTIQKNERKADKIFHHIAVLLDQGKYNPYRDSTAVWNLAHFFHDHGNFDRALMLADHLAEHYDYDALWFFKGHCYVRKGDQASAVNAFYKAWQRNPTDPPILYWYGKCLVQTGRKEEGCRLLRSAAENTINAKAADRSRMYMEKFCSIYNK